MKPIDISQVNKLIHDSAFRKSLINHSDNITFPGKPEDVKFKVVENTKDTFYFAIPKDASNISGNSLENINAAGAFTVSTAGSLGSITSTVSTAGTAGTALVINGDTY